MVQEPDRHGQLCRLYIAQVPGIPPHRQGGSGTLYCCAVVQLYAATCAGVRRKRIPVGGNREQGDGWEPLISRGPLPWLEHCMFYILSPLLFIGLQCVPGGVFSGLLSSYDGCLLLACIDFPSEALVCFLINRPSACSVLSRYSAPCLLLLFNELVAKIADVKFIFI